MVYYYEIDENDNFVLSGHDIHKRTVTLNGFEVEFLRKVLENELLDSLLKRFDYLRGALEAENGIELKTYYVLIKALVNQSFRTNFEVIEPRYYVHVLPDHEGYLNANQDAFNGLYFDTKKQWGGSQTKFTKEEIEELKKMPSLKGINFDECLEEVQEDED